MERGWMGWLGSRLIHYVWYNPRVERAPLSQTSLTTTHRPVSPRIHIFPTQKPNPLCQSPFIPLFCERIITRTPSFPPVTRGWAEQKQRISIPVSALPVQEFWQGKSRKICNSLNWFKGVTFTFWIKMHRKNIFPKINSKNYKFSIFFPARIPVPAMPEPKSKFFVSVPLTPYPSLSPLTPSCVLSSVVFQHKSSKSQHFTSSPSRVVTTNEGPQKSKANLWLRNCTAPESSWQFFTCTNIFHR